MRKESNEEAAFEEKYMGNGSRLRKIESGLLKVKISVNPVRKEVRREFSKMKTNLKALFTHCELAY